MGVVICDLLLNKEQSHRAGYVCLCNSMPSIDMKVLFYPWAFISKDDFNPFSSLILKVAGPSSNTYRVVLGKKLNPSMLVSSSVIISVSKRGVK